MSVDLLNPAKARKARKVPPRVLSGRFANLGNFGVVSTCADCPGFPASARSLRLCFWTSICRTFPRAFAWICCPQLPHHPCKTGRTAQVFAVQGGTHRAKGHFGNGHFELQCARERPIFSRGLAGLLFLSEGSSLFLPFSSLNVAF